MSHHPSFRPVFTFFHAEKAEPQSKYTFSEEQSTERALRGAVVGRFQSITLATLQRARQDRKDRGRLLQGGRWRHGDGGEGEKRG